MNAKRCAKASAAVFVTALLAALVFTVVPSLLAPLAALIAIPATLLLISTAFERSDSGFDRPGARGSSAI